MNPSSYRLLTLSEAEADIAGAVGWYEERERGLGMEFLRTFRAGTAVLLRNPYLYQPVMGEVRRLLLRRFPYAVFYEIRGGDHAVGCAARGA